MRMKDITLKPESLRQAIATATLKAPPECIELLRRGETEKGDALKTARVAGILAAKRCDEMIPLCHPLPIYSSEITFVLDAAAVHIQASVETIAATGVEMEALLAANVAALTIYDMLKPHTEQENLLLTDCKLLQKTGGKSHFKRKLKRRCSAMVIVLSDTVAQGKKEDTAGRSICDVLTTAGFDPIGYCVLPDESAELEALLKENIAQAGEFDYHRRRYRLRAARQNGGSGHATAHAGSAGHHGSGARRSDKSARRMRCCRAV
jgi:molybdenum cofactor biosynthesis protein MoaC